MRTREGREKGCYTVLTRVPKNEGRGEIRKTKEDNL